MIDLNDMERKLDEALSKETKETLTDFVNMKRNKVKINKGERTKQTGIEYLRDIYKHDYRCPIKFDTAEKMQLEVMDEFSQWLLWKGWLRNEYGFWYNKNIIGAAHKFSGVYQMFLDSKKTN